MKEHKKLIALLVATFVLFCAWNAYSAHEDKIYQQHIDQSIDEEYQTVIGMLNQDHVTDAEWKQVESKLDRQLSPSDYYAKDFRAHVKRKLEEYPDLPVIKDYVKGMVVFNSHTYSTNAQQYKEALRHLDMIPSNYDGILADRMAVNHKYVKHMYEEAQGYLDQIKADKAAEKAVNIEIGDPETKIVQILGTPIDVNTTTVSGSEHKQYVFSGNRYVYTVNGIVTAMQNIQHQS